MTLKKFLAIVLGMIFTVSCATRPGEQKVTVSDQDPPTNCREIGPVIGTSHSREGSREKALEDLRYEASLKMANYVKVQAISAHGGAARGLAYRCD